VTVILLLSDGTLVTAISYQRKYYVTSIHSSTVWVSTITRWSFNSGGQLIRTPESYGYDGEHANVRSMVELNYEDVVNTTTTTSNPNNNRTLFFASCDRGRIVLWNVYSGQAMLYLYSPTPYSVLIKLRQNKTPGLYVSNSSERALLVWSIRNGLGCCVNKMKFVACVGVEKRIVVEGLCELEDGRLVAASTNYVAVYDMTSFTCTQVIEVDTAFQLLEAEPGVIFLKGERDVAAWNINTGAYNPSFLVPLP